MLFYLLRVPASVLKVPVPSMGSYQHQSYLEINAFGSFGEIPSFINHGNTTNELMTQ